MPTPRRFFPLIVLVCAGLLNACSTTGRTPTAADDENDPFETLNRSVFAFNEGFDKHILKPAAQVYDAALHDDLKAIITRVFTNLSMPTVVINDLLQGKLQQTAQDTARFLINSTLGFAGMFDAAVDFGLPANEEDFGQTLGVWGIADGPYLVLPIIGPKTMRDGFGWVVDQFTYPLNYADDNALIWGAYIVDIVDRRANFLPSDKVLEQAAGDDKYLFVREAYRQRRRNLIYDGNPPKEELFLDEPAAPIPADPAR
jgi:phospholipid-binding lipoprotein MlaA